MPTRYFSSGDTSTPMPYHINNQGLVCFIEWRVMDSHIVGDSAEYMIAPEIIPLQPIMNASGYRSTGNINVAWLSYLSNG